MENRYDFKRRMLEVHRPARKNDAVWTKITGITFDDSTEILYSRSAGRVLTYVAHDLAEYFNVSLDIYPHLRACTDITSERRPGTIVLATAEDFPALAPADNDPVENPRAKALAYRILAENGCVTVIGASERGTAQGSYALERIMNTNEGPVIQERDETVTALFSPRMTHSGYELDTFPDNVLKAIAHEGMDAIKVFTKGVNKTEHGYQDFNELIWRAEGFGLDVYCYSYYKSRMHPDDPGAREYYESLYGELFSACPGFRGVIFVGESIGFPSHDPHTSMERPLPPGKDHPGWYPCCDYPQWVNMVKSVIHRHAPNCEIVFWTYNWGYQPEEARLALIRSLPRDISLLVTYEMFELREVAPGIIEKCADYTLGFEGPGQYFLSEAKAARECGIRLYAMSNTGGLTWDVGDVPYLPTPQQWNRRWQGILHAHDTYGLCGLMEGHHYGFVPSFISELAHTLYSRVNGISPDFDTEAQKIAVRDFGMDKADAVLQAWNLWSDGLRRIATEAYDQYGVLRLGPAYPLTFRQTVKIPTLPWASHSTDDNIVACTYFQDVLENAAKYVWELHSMEEMERLFREGCALFDTVLPALSGQKLISARRLSALGHFIHRTAATYVANKRWHLLKCVLLGETGRCADDPGDRFFFTGFYDDAPHQMLPEGVSLDRTLLLSAVGLPADAADSVLMDCMEQIILGELENTRQTIPCVREDSRIGFEPTMEYVADEPHLLWKIGVTEDSLAALRAYRQAHSL